VHIEALQFIGAAGFHALERGQHAAERMDREFVVVADPWKIRIANLVCDTSLNIQLATDTGAWDMYAQALPALVA